MCFFLNRWKFASAENTNENLCWIFCSRVLFEKWFSPTFIFTYTPAALISLELINESIFNSLAKMCFLLHFLIKWKSSDESERAGRRKRKVNKFEFLITLFIHASTSLNPKKKVKRRRKTLLWCCFSACCCCWSSHLWAYLHSDYFEHWNGE